MTKSNPETNSGLAKKKKNLIKKSTNSQKKKIKAVAKNSINDSWPEIINELKSYNHSFSAILANCQLKQVAENKITLVVKRKFYQKRIMETKNRKKIQNVIKKFTDKSYLIDCSIEEKEDHEASADQTKKEYDNLAQKAKEIF